MLFTLSTYHHILLMHAHAVSLIFTQIWMVLIPYSSTRKHIYRFGLWSLCYLCVYASWWIMSCVRVFYTATSPCCRYLSWCTMCCISEMLWISLVILSSSETVPILVFIIRKKDLLPVDCHNHWDTTIVWLHP